MLFHNKLRKKKFLNRFIIRPPPQMCKTNIANIIKIYKKKLSLRTAPFYYPENAYFLMLQSPHKLICLLGDCCSVTAYCKSIICQRKTVYCSCKVKSCHSGRLCKYRCSFRTAIHCNIYCICYRS